MTQQQTAGPPVTGPTDLAEEFLDRRSRGVLLHRLDPGERSTLRFVRLGSRDHLAVTRMQIEPKLAGAALLEHELPSHGRASSIVAGPIRTQSGRRA
mgnify:CR=1 FL=1